MKAVTRDPANQVVHLAVAADVEAETAMVADTGTPFVRALADQLKKNHIRLHVPAHAGGDLTKLLPPEWGQAVFPYDMTELPPLDVLGNPQGVLKASQESVARIFGSAHAFYLINGASVGIMAALMVCGRSGEVLIARNCHRSVIHGLVLTGQTPRWLLPEPREDWGIWGEVTPESLEAALDQYPEVGCFVLTHPTYEGVASDIDAIAAICRARNVTLIVDEAHGSLWALSHQMPRSAIEAEADCVIHSTHKTAGSLTQTAVLHLPHGSRLDPADIQEALNLLQTTSPSQVLLASLEAACFFWGSPQGKQILSRRIEMAQRLRHQLAHSLETISVLDGTGPFQLYLRADKLTGEDFAVLLEDTYGLAFESYTEKGVLLLLNPGLPETSMAQIQSVLGEVDRQSAATPEVVTYAPIDYSLPEMACTPTQAFYAPGITLPVEEAVGRISKQVVANCPPGIPIVIPGEIIGKRHVPYLPAMVRVLEG